VHGSTIGDWKPATRRNYANQLQIHLVPAFGRGSPHGSSPRTCAFGGACSTIRGIAAAPCSTATPTRSSRRSGRSSTGESRTHRSGEPDARIKKHREPPPDKAPFFSPEEVMALVRTAERRHQDATADPQRRERAAASQHDAAIFLVAASTGLRRGELISLRWEAVDFSRRSTYVIENVSAGEDARVKDHDGRTVPMATDVAQTLARLRPDGAHEEDLVFPSRLGKKLDGDALSSRYAKTRKAAGLPPLRFHDLRHTFGSLAIDGGASIIQVKDWMGHADVKTTMRYLHSKSRAADAALLDGASSGDGGFRAALLP
jgi:integrase